MFIDKIKAPKVDLWPNRHISYLRINYVDKGTNAFLWLLCLLPILLISGPGCYEWVRITPSPENRFAQRYEKVRVAARPPGDASAPPSRVSPDDWTMLEDVKIEGPILTATDSHTERQRVFDVRLSLVEVRREVPVAGSGPAPRFSCFLLPGFGYGRLFGSDFMGGFVELRVGGAVTNHLSLMGGARFQAGSTLPGLRFYQVSALFAVTVRVGNRLVLGGMISAGGHMLPRWTKPELGSWSAIELQPELQVLLSNNVHRTAAWSVRPGLWLADVLHPGFSLLTGVGYVY